MIKKIALFIFLSMSFFCVKAQTIVLKGIVKDSIQTPLPYANVIAKPLDKAKNLSFAITDDEGYYKLKLLIGETYTISISYIGYETINYTFLASKDIVKNFVVKESKNQLDEIIIELPVTVKGDTTTYNTDKFVTGEERKLKNILKKLPGVEVDKNGNVTANGKKITTMLVDGKKFFGGGSKLAVDNIPADAVDKVQVIDNYNEVAFLKNLTDSDKTAMNIELKEDKKRFVFGDIEAGIGNKDYYRTHANLFYYSPKTNVNFIGNLNNTGEKTFTFKDYLNFSGGVNAVFRGGFKFKGGDFSQFLETRDLVSSSQKFGALNITKATSDNFDISGFAIFSHTKTGEFIETQNQYPTLTEEKTQTTNKRTVFGIGNLNLEYAPNSKTQWYAKTQVKNTDNQKNNQITSVRNSNPINIATLRKGTATSVNQIVEWHKQSSNEHTFSSTINYLFDKNNPLTNWQTNQPILQGLIPVNQPQNNYLLTQEKETNQHNLYGEFKHFWVLNNNNHIYTTIGNNFKKELFFTNDYQTLDNGSINNFSTNDFGNDINFKLNDFFLGVHYKFRTGIFTFKQGAFAHNYRWRINQNQQDNKWVVLPDFLVKIKFNKSRNLQIAYNLKTNFSDASKLTNRFYLQSYNSVYKGNPNLGNELFHTARVYYSRFSLYRGLMMHANINYTKKEKGFITDFQPQGIDQNLTTLLIDNPNEDWFFNAFVSKRIKKIKYKLDVDASFSNFLQKNVNNIEKNKNNNYSYELVLETLFDDFPILEIGYKRSIGKYIQPNATTKFTVDESFVNLDYDFLKGFIFSFDYRFYNYQNKSQGLKNIYEIANTTLSYKNENSAWSYKITAQNLFNTQFKQSNSFSTFLISDRKTYVLPRIIMFSVGYNL